MSLNIKNSKAEALARALATDLAALVSPIDVA